VTRISADESTPELIGRYRVIAKLGEGGMGVVYRAYDAKLQRTVAIKVLGGVSDLSARKRLLQEARAASALNHPHICTVHEVDDAGPLAFIVMEHVEGRPLSDAIPPEGFPADTVLHDGLQIADALAHAHDRGIVHGDVKASNVLTTPEGRIKVVDFGLATRVGGDEVAEVTTQSTLLTEPGVLRGTLPYMAPEQLRGERADARSDVWALGVLLFEMTTGTRPFHGQTGFEMSSAILSQQAAPLPENTLSPLRAVISRCLEKDPQRRYQRAGEVRAALEAIQTGAVLPRAVWRGPVRWRRWAWAAALPVMLAAAYFGRQAWRPPEPGEPLKAVPLTTLPGVELYPSISPDGNYVAFAWNGSQQNNYDIYVQMIGAGSPLRLTTDPRSEQNPVWSPDGKWIAFLRGESPSRVALEGKVELRLIPPLGGPERKVADIQLRAQPNPPGYVAWCPDSRCLIVTDEQGERKPYALFVVSLDTGEKRLLTNPQPPALGDSNPVVAPDGRSIVFQRQSTGAAAELFWLPLKENLTTSGEPKRLTTAALNAIHPTWTPDGKDVLFSARGSLWRLALSGQASPTRLPFVGEDGLWPVVSRPQPGRPARLVYGRSFVDTNIWRVDTSALGAVSSSPPAVSIASTRGDMSAQFSPDGRRVAFVSDRGGTSEIWLADRDGSNAIQLTSMDAPSIDSPRWSPDGQTIAFDSNPEGQRDIYLVAAAGGKPRRFTTHPAIDILPNFSRDGTWIYFCSTRAGARQIWKMPAAGGDAVQVSDNIGWAASESPDGAYVYYTQSSGPEPSALWRLPTSGGQQRVKVLEGVVMRAFAVLEGGIYYIDRPERETRLQYFDFGTGKSTMVSRDLGEVRSSLSASPDGRTILYTRIDSSIDDLMLVENFR
jgi:eukaryotic-like serine/threonine-protein kinase